MKQGPAAQADMDAARKVWEDLDEDAREFLTFVYQFDSQWSNVKDCARVYAVKRRHTLTATMKAFDQANRRLAITRGIIDNWKGDTPDE